MAHIGTLGKVVFEVSSNKVQTFRDFSRSSTAQTAKHNIVGRKPRLEFLAPDLEEITFAMKLKKDLGVNITETMEELRMMRDTGKVVPLIIAGEPVTDNKWLITSLSEGSIQTDGRGNIINMEVNVSLTEYVEDIVPVNSKNITV